MTAARREVPIFAVLDTGVTVDADGTRWATASIDATGHPEVSDLARVHAVEGVGDIATEAALADDVLLLAVTVSVPVRCAFGLAFQLPEHRPVLVAAAAAGHLVIATTDPVAARSDRPLWLAIDLDAEGLGRLLVDV
ncbi:MAG: hypothetical protein AB8G26_17465 [Ilumatobacter sp.]